MNDPTWTPKKSLSRSPSVQKSHKNTEPGKVRFAFTGNNRVVEVKAKELENSGSDVTSDERIGELSSVAGDHDLA